MPLYRFTRRIDGRRGLYIYSLMSVKWPAPLLSQSLHPEDIDSKK